MLIDSEIFTEVNPTEGWSDLDSDLDSVQVNVALDAAPAMGLLDASSLNTVLVMLEVIDSAEELALLETLTPEQKRQVWNATPEPTRNRLKQLRTKPESEFEPKLEPEPELEFVTPPLNPASEDTSDSSTAHEATQEAELMGAEEAAIDFDLSESLDFLPQTQLATGDWVVLQAKPQLNAAELMAIWEVLEVRGKSARIIAGKLGIRTYPTAWMVPYPKPVDYIEPEF
jgi:hypothetical protein